MALGPIELLVIGFPGNRFTGGILPEIEVRNRTVILVDEGIDTGARMLGAIASVRDRGASAHSRSLG